MTSISSNSFYVFSRIDIPLSHCEIHCPQFVTFSPAPFFLPLNPAHRAPSAGATQRISTTAARRAKCRWQSSSTLSEVRRSSGHQLGPGGLVTATASVVPANRHGQLITREAKRLQCVRSIFKNAGHSPVDHMVAWISKLRTSAWDYGPNITYNVKLLRFSCLFTAGVYSASVL
jgi:hypothetical protein